MKGNVAVIGAGLVGSVAGLSLAHEGYNVTIFELRADPRLADTGDKNLRSINLAVSSRGIRTLKMVDPEMAERVLTDVLPMKGRMIHDLKGDQAEQLYGLYGEAIYSIDRGVLNENLLHEIKLFDEAKNEGSIQTKFEHKLLRIDFGDDNDDAAPVELTFRRKHTNDDIRLKFDMVIGADGAHSATRTFLGKKVLMNYSQQYIDKCYIELYIPPSHDPNNKFSISPNHLHIWPRGDFMLIALPNTDGSFTSTFFGPWKLTESLKTDEQISSFFSKHFRDAVDLIGETALVHAFQNNPKGSLVQVTCSPYNFKGKCIIIGDAAHSMVPFYGQGMNCGFEDIRVLMELLSKHNHVSEDAFEAFTETRHNDLLAILSLALANYHEMSAKVTSNLYKLRKTTDGLLHKLLGDHWVPLYTMVSFRDDIPYHEALKIEAHQHRLISMLGGATIISASAALLYGLKRAFKY